MVHQEPIDEVFLKRLQQAYSRELDFLSPPVPYFVLSDILPLQYLVDLFLPPNPEFDDQARAMHKKKIDLETALAAVRAELTRLSSAQQSRVAQVQSVAVSVEPDDCDHWSQLLNTHARVIRVLERDEAYYGSEFRYSKRIELDERRKRVDELRQMIDVNCS